MCTFRNTKTPLALHANGKLFIWLVIFNKCTFSSSSMYVMEFYVATRHAISTKEKRTKKKKNFVRKLFENRTQISKCLAFSTILIVSVELLYCMH